MSALDVFHDEIAHLVLTKQRTRQQVYTYLVRKYGVHKGLTSRNVRRFCQIKGYPKRRTKSQKRRRSAIANNLRKVIPDDDDTQIANDEFVIFEQIVTEDLDECANINIKFNNNSVQKREVQDSVESLLSMNQQQGEDHEYHVPGSGSIQQGNRLQKETNINIPVTVTKVYTTSTTGEEPSTVRAPAGDRGVTNQEEVSAGDGGASSSTADGNVDAASSHQTSNDDDPVSLHAAAVAAVTSALPSTATAAPSSQTQQKQKYRVIAKSNKRLISPAVIRKRKGGATVVVGDQLTEYQRQKLQKMDVQNQHFKNTAQELEILRTGLFAVYDIRVSSK